MTSPVEEIKSRIDVVELVGSYIKLTRAGANMKALCPFHTEKTPSFNVSPARQIWHCFGCGKGGDHFKFVMEIEGLDFPEALRLLAQRAGVELKREDPRVRSERNRMYDLLEDAAQYYQKNLESVSVVKSYLKKRGVSDKTINDFRVGFSFDAWDGLLKHLAQKGYKEAEIEKAGLAVKSENGSWYDRFRSRIIFPVSDANGRVVGFGGRIFEPVGIASSGKRESSEAMAKYINTPQTPVYDKSRVLYAYDKAKESIRKKNCCVIVEGYMDAVMSHQAGVINAVAVSGTALTPEHLKAIKRLAETLVSSFDRDTAGEAATKRSLDLAAEFGFERKVAFLPDGVKDPADAVLANPDTWVKAVEGAMPIVEFYFTRSLARHNTASSTGVRTVSQEVLPEIANLANEMEKAHWVGKLSKTLGISEESVWQELAKIKKIGKVREMPGEKKSTDQFSAKSRKEKLEELSVGSLALFPHLASDYSGFADELFSRNLNRDIFDGIASGRSGKTFADLEDYLKGLTFQAEVFLEPVEDKENAVRRILLELRAEHLKEKRDEITRKIVDAQRLGNETLLVSLSAEHKDISDKIHKVTSPNH